jgi:hypothetical protein
MLAESLLGFRKSGLLISLEGRSEARRLDTPWAETHFQAYIWIEGSTETSHGRTEYIQKFDAKGVTSDIA